MARRGFLSHFSPVALLAGALGNGLWGLIAPGVGLVASGVTTAATSLPWYLLVVIGIGAALLTAPFVALALRYMRGRRVEDKPTRTTTTFKVRGGSRVVRPSDVHSRADSVFDLDEQSVVYDPDRIQHYPDSTSGKVENEETVDEEADREAP